MIVSLVLLASLAHADVVGPEPTNCPPGSRGVSSHAGEWCEATECPPDTCADDERCVEQGLCVEVEVRECGGNRPDTAEPCTFEAHIAHGRCRTDDDCDAGTCEIADRCVARGPLGGGCGCAAVDGLPAAFAGALLLVGALARRVRAA